MGKGWYGASWVVVIGVVKRSEPPHTITQPRLVPLGITDIWIASAVSAGNVSTLPTSIGMPYLLSGHPGVHSVGSVTSVPSGRKTPTPSSWSRCLNGALQQPFVGSKPCVAHVCAGSEIPVSDAHT